MDIVAEALGHTRMTREAYAERMHAQGKEKGWTPEQVEEFIEAAWQRALRREREEIADYHAGQTQGATATYGNKGGETRASNGHGEFLRQQAVYKGTSKE
jgi:hypothetical protein